MLNSEQVVTFPETTFASVPELLKELQAGRMIVLLDDEDRENEGDLVISAKFATPEAINFMARFGRGLICMPMSEKQCDQLELPMMVTRNQSRYHTNFTVSIESATGVTTGISAKDRAKTISVAANPAAKPEDVIMPGHIFPLKAVNGGVEERAGHTEAVVDLMKLAGLGEAGVLVEILNDDGSMARRDDLMRFSELHQLAIGTICDLVDFKQKLKKEL